MTSHFRKTLIAAAVSALMVTPVWAADHVRSTDAATGTSGAEMGTPGAAGTTSSPGMRGQGADTRSTTARSESAPAGQARGTQQMTGPLYSRTVDDLKGMDVVDQSGDDIGKVDRIVLGPDRQQAHAVVTIGGLLGMGGRDVMVSLDQLQLAGDDKLRINSTKEQLEALPEVSDEQEDRYVELSGDRPLRESIQNFAAFEPGMRGQGADTRSTAARSESAPTGQALGTQQMTGPLYSRTADDLTGMDIVDPNGDDIGKVDRIVLGPNREEAHVIVTIGGLLGMGGRDVMISLEQLQLEGDDKLRVSASREQLEALPEVSDEQEDRYVELSGDRPLRESIQDFAAFEPGQQPDGTLRTPQPSMGQPGAPGMGERGGPSGTTPRTQ